MGKRKYCSPPPHIPRFGVFAEAELPGNAIIAEYGGELMTEREALARGPTPWSDSDMVRGARTCFPLTTTVVAPSPCTRCCCPPPPPPRPPSCAALGPRAWFSFLL